mgnify:CR=1 FL=1
MSWQTLLIAIKKGIVAGADNKGFINCLKDGVDMGAFGADGGIPKFRKPNTTTASTIFFTGNKPISQYAGNGSSAARTQVLVENGIGKILLVYSGSNAAIVMPPGAILIKNNAISWLDGSKVFYVDGKLTTVTADICLNASNTTYYYQVI